MESSFLNFARFVASLLSNVRIGWEHKTHCYGNAAILIPKRYSQCCHCAESNVMKRRIFSSSRKTLYTTINKATTIFFLQKPTFRLTLTNASSFYVNLKHLASVTSSRWRFRDIIAESKVVTVEKPFGEKGLFGILWAGPSMAMTSSLFHPFRMHVLKWRRLAVIILSFPGHFVDRVRINSLWTVTRPAMTYNQNDDPTL